MKDNVSKSGNCVKGEVVDFSLQEYDSTIHYYTNLDFTEVDLANFFLILYLVFGLTMIGIIDIFID